MSFNDVISDLIAKVHPVGNPYLSNSIQKLRSEQRPGNHTQTVPSPAKSDVKTEVSRWVMNIIIFFPTQFYQLSRPLYIRIVQEIGAPTEDVQRVQRTCLRYYSSTKGATSVMNAHVNC